VAPIAAAALAAGLFLQAVVRLRRRGRADLASWDRVALFAPGLAVSVFALVGPLDRIADEKLLAAHMGQHVLIGDLGPALIALAAAQANLYTGLLSNRAANAALQIHGGYGFTDEFAISRLYRDQKILEIGEGTNEVQRMVIARQLGF
jgi:alkylation response protein AidB-like acyl-CoA dehydrogenase